MKKFLFWLILICFIAALGTYFWSKKGFNTFSTKDTTFSISDSSILDKIEITGPYGRTLVLERWEDSEKWTVDGRYVAAQEAIDLLLETLEKMRVNYPVPKAAKENVLKKMANSPRKVKLFSNGENIKTILMAGTPQNAKKGTFMSIEGSEEPYVVHIPGFEGFMGSRFFVDAQDWRHRIAVKTVRENIESIKVSYPNEMKNSFEIAKKGDKWEVLPLGHEANQTSMGQTASQAMIEAYLEGYKQLPVEAYENFYPRKDSLSKTSPSTIFEIAEKGGKKSKLTIFPMPRTERSKSQTDHDGKELPYDLDRYFLEFNDGKDWAIIQHRSYAPVLLKYQDFFKAN